MTKRITTRERSKIKIRKSISGTAACPRLTVYRSLTGIYAQVIDDTKGITILSASSKDEELQEKVKGLKGKISVGKVVGKLLAEKAKAKNINKVVFDRNGYQYHGRVKAMAEGAREGGLVF